MKNAITKIVRIVTTFFFGFFCDHPSECVTITVYYEQKKFADDWIKRQEAMNAELESEIKKWVKCD